MNISIVGLGRLGAPMAAVMAQKGHVVIGVDNNEAVLDAVSRGIVCGEEPGLAEMLCANRDRISATLDCEAAVLATDVTFIVVPTPSEADGRFSNRFVIDAAQRVGTALGRKQSRHLVVLSSTVMPGSTGRLLGAIEERSGKRCGEDFGLCYSPEFIALGSVIRDLLRPDMVLIGESDPRAGDSLAALYRGLCESNPIVQRMNFVNAELTKLLVNTFVTTKISYANMVGEVCETLPGADAAVVTAAIGCDSRIGSKYLKAALGYGGPCFPRDNLAFAALARENNAPALLAEATDQINRRQAPRLAQLIRDLLPPDGVAGILGLSYKPDTDVVEESQGLETARLLLASGVQVAVYDPAAMPNARKVLSRRACMTRTAAECTSVADVVAITTPWPAFRSIQPTDLKKSGVAQPVVIDCWRLLDPKQFEPCARYLMLGIG